MTWFEQAPSVPVYFIQEKASPVEATGWKTQIRLPGLDLFYDLYQTSEPELTMVRMIFVVDLCRYTPCKSLLLHGTLFCEYLQVIISPSFISSANLLRSVIFLVDQLSFNSWSLHSGYLFAYPGPLRITSHSMHTFE